jgi:hypothetical protein
LPKDHVVGLIVSLVTEELDDVIGGHGHLPFGLAAPDVRRYPAETASRYFVLAGPGRTTVC